MEEGVLVDRLFELSLPVVVHPNIIQNFDLWAKLGSQLLIENLDYRKDQFWTVNALTTVFEKLPEAKMCLDVSHAMSSGGDALIEEMLLMFADRVGQIHVGCTGGPRATPALDLADRSGIRTVKNCIRVPIIIERANLTADELCDYVNILSL